PRAATASLDLDIHLAALWTSTSRIRWTSTSYDGGRPGHPLHSPLDIHFTTSLDIHFLHSQHMSGPEHPHALTRVPKPSIRWMSKLPTKWMSKVSQHLNGLGPSTCASRGCPNRLSGGCPKPAVAPEPGPAAQSCRVCTMGCCPVACSFSACLAASPCG